MVCPMHQAVCSFRFCRSSIALNRLSAVCCSDPQLSLQAACFSQRKSDCTSDGLLGSDHWQWVSASVFATCGSWSSGCSFRFPFAWASRRISETRAGVRIFCTLSSSAGSVVASKARPPAFGLEANSRVVGLGRGSISCSSPCCSDRSLSLAWQQHAGCFIGKAGLSTR